MRIHTPRIRINDSKTGLFYMREPGVRDVRRRVDRYKLTVVPKGHPFGNPHISRFYAEINK